jgi:ATP-binding cassette subfamily C (CFTR/MRP) protein 1
MSAPHRNSDESSSSAGAVATVDVSVKVADTEAALKPVGAAALGLISDKDSLPIRWHTPNPFEAVTFWHVFPLISRGHVRRLEPEDLCRLPEMESERLANAFDRDWAAERAKHPEKPSLVRACLVGSRPTFIFTGVLYLLAQATLFSGPLLLRRIVEAIECNEAGGENCASNTDMYVFALIMTLAGVVQNFCQASQDYYMQRLGVRVRNRLMCALYRKCLKLSPQGLQEETTGKIVTLMSNDVNKLQDLFQLLHNLWGAPIFIVASFVMLYDVIQWSSFVGFACIIVAAPLTFMVAKTLFQIRKKLLVCADGRINILSEVINGMRVIKYYAWESAFAARVREIRDKEVKLIWASQRVGALFGVALFSTPVFIAVCSLGSYSLAGKTLSASTAYTALALFNMLRFPLILVPFLLTTLLNALSAVQRLGAFLLQDESPVVPPDMSDPGRVIVNDATFRWPKAPKKPEEAPPAKPLKKGAKKPTKPRKGVPVKGEDDAPAGDAVAVAAEAPEQPPFELQNISLDLKPGSLTMVIGRVGCGKSTFLSALNRFVPNVAGDFSVSGRVAYVAQQAWILNSTIRENILFGKPYDAAKYARCVKASQLQTDFEILPGGDGTIIGERGVTLSGGQKQRVAIARAVYAAADVYLMDDPLSAVDNHVGAALFDQVLSHDGALRNATRVLATNALHFLPKADRVVVIEDGRVAEMGTYDELMSKGLNFASLMAAHGIENDEEGEQRARQFEARALGGPQARALHGRQKSALGGRQAGGAGAGAQEGRDGR